MVRSRFGVVLGTSTSGIDEHEKARAYRARTGEWPAGTDYRQWEIGSLSDFAALVLGVTGPAYTIATACSASAKVFASGRRLIEAGICDAVIVGGADTLAGMTVAGFSSLEAMSRGLCNPFSRNRDGINIGEGAAAFLMVRDETAVNLLGSGECSDAYHISAPEPDGKGAHQAMRLALDDAGLRPDEVAYINLHGTGTPLNDAMEAKAVAALFGTATPCSSTKAMIGHALGAAGACEAAFLWLTLHPTFNPDQRLPPHLWDGVGDPEMPAIRAGRRGRTLRGAHADASRCSATPSPLAATMSPWHLAARRGRDAGASSGRDNRAATAADGADRRGRGPAGRRDHGRCDGPADWPVLPSRSGHALACRARVDGAGLCGLRRKRGDRRRPPGQSRLFARHARLSTPIVGGLPPASACTSGPALRTVTTRWPISTAR